MRPCPRRLTSSFSDDPAVDESQLIARIRSGDAAAFEIVFRRYWAPLCVFALRYVKRRDAAQDVVSDVFTRLWETRAGWDVRVSAKAYLYAAVRCRALNVLRHDLIAARDDGQNPDELPNTSERSDERLIRDEMTAALRAELDALPERTRLIVTLRWYDRLSHAEIAETLNLSVRSVGNRLTYALNLLRARLAHRR